MKFPLAIELVSFSHANAEAAGVYPFCSPDSRTFQHIFDVRYLPNPFNEPTLRDLNGLDKAVRQYVLQSLSTHLWTLMSEVVRTLLKKAADEPADAAPLTVRFCFGCTGGKHRSVALAAEFHDWLMNTHGDECLSISIRHLALETLGVTTPPLGQPTGAIV